MIPFVIGCFSPSSPNREAESDIVTYQRSQESSSELEIETKNLYFGFSEFKNKLYYRKIEKLGSFDIPVAGNSRQPKLTGLGL